MRFLTLGLWLFASACWAESSVDIADLSIREPLPGQSMAAGYFELHNSGSEAVELLRVESNFKARIEMHLSFEEEGLMKMRQLEQVVVEPGETLSFKPGGRHLMIMGFDPEALAAENLELSFHFANGESVSAQAELVGW